MIFDLEGPIKVIAFGKVTQPHGFWHQGRIIPYHLLVYCTSGFMTMRVKDTEYICNSGDVMLIPSYTYYTPLYSPGCTYYFLHFKAETTQKYDKGLKVNLGAVLPEGSYHYEYEEDYHATVEISPLTRGRAPETVLPIFEKLAALDPRVNPSHKLLIDTLLRELLITISSDPTTTAQPNKHLSNIISYIRTNYPEELTLGSISEKFQLSSSYVARLFKENIHQRTSDFINNVRIQAACDMLINSDASINQISDRVGYASIYYFSRIFKKICGTSPRDFRNGKRKNGG